MLEVGRGISDVTTGDVVVLRPHWWQVRAFFREFRRYAGQFFTNWREYDAPVTRKLALGVRNRLKPTFARQQCCGHPGQPGC